MDKKYGYNFHCNGVLILNINIYEYKIMQFTVIIIKTPKKWSKSIETNFTLNDRNVTSIISTIN